jgi:hypothetical protein
VLNRVTFANVNTIVGSPQFGLPVQANTMRSCRAVCDGGFEQTG